MDPRTGLNWMLEGADGAVGQFGRLRIPARSAPRTAQVNRFQAPVRASLKNPWASISITRREGNTTDFRGFANGNVLLRDVEVAKAFLVRQQCSDPPPPAYEGYGGVGAVTCGHDWVNVTFWTLPDTPGPFYPIPMNPNGFSGRVRTSDAHAAVNILKLQFKTWGQHCIDNGELYDPISQRCFRSCPVGTVWNAQALACQQTMSTRF